MATERNPIVPMSREAREERDKRIKEGLTDERLSELAHDVIDPHWTPGPLDGVELRFALHQLMNWRQGRKP